MPQSIVTQAMLVRLNILGRLAVDYFSVADDVKKAFIDVYNLGKEEGLSDKDIRTLIEQELRNKGISDRTIMRMLPDQLKNQQMRALGQSGGGHNKKEVIEDLVTIPVSELERLKATIAALPAPTASNPVVISHPTTAVDDTPRADNSTATPRTIADIVTRKEDGEEHFPYLEGKIKALQSKNLELEEALRNTTFKKATVSRVRVKNKLFGQLSVALRSTVEYVDLVVNENGEVVDLEVRKKN